MCALCARTHVCVLCVCHSEMARGAVHKRRPTFNRARAAHNRGAAHKRRSTFNRARAAYNRGASTLTVTISPVPSHFATTMFCSCSNGIPNGPLVPCLGAASVFICVKDNATPTCHSSCFALRGGCIEQKVFDFSPCGCVCLSERVRVHSVAFPNCAMPQRSTQDEVIDMD